MKAFKNFAAPAVLMISLSACATTETADGAPVESSSPEERSTLEAWANKADQQIGKMGEALTEFGEDVADTTGDLYDASATAIEEGAEAFKESLDESEEDN